MFTLEVAQLWHQAAPRTTSTVPGGARRSHPRQLRAALARHGRRHH